MNIIPNDIAYEQFIGLQESQYVRPIADFTDDIKSRFKNGYILVGDKLPWHKKVKTRN